MPSTILKHLEITQGTAKDSPFPASHVSIHEEPCHGQVYALTLAIVLRLGQIWPERIAFECRGDTLEEIIFNREMQRVENLPIPLHREGDQLSFLLRLNLLSFPSNAKIEVTADAPPSARVTLATIEIDREPLRPPYQPVFSPILLDALTHTGTTLLMKILRAHPGIFVHDRHPFELCAASYWYYALEALSSPTVPGRSFDRITPRELRHGLRHVPPPPYYNDAKIAGPEALYYLGNPYLERLAEWTLKNVDEFYQVLIEAEQRTVQPLYIAEKWTKLPYVNPFLVQELYPKAKRIFLFRDIRDRICSTFARDTTEYALPEKRAIVERECQAFNRQYHKWQQSSAHLIRYEDLIDQPRETITALMTRLDLPISAEDIDMALHQANFESTEMKSHVTSGSVKNSIQRFQAELDPELQQLCMDLCSESLSALYDASHHPL